MTIGIETARHKNIPALIVELTSNLLFSALYLVIILDTVIGIPDDVNVKSRPKIVSVIW